MDSQPGAQSSRGGAAVADQAVAAVVAAEAAVAEGVADVAAAEVRGGDGSFQRRTQRCLAASI